MRLKAKLQKKLGLWHCWECDRLTKRFGYKEGVRVPLCKIHLDKEKGGLYNYVNTEPMNLEEIKKEHVYAEDLEQRLADCV